MAGAVPQHNFSDLNEIKLWDVAIHTRDEDSAIAWCQQNGLIRHTPICGHCRVEMPIRPNYKQGDVDS